MNVAFMLRQAWRVIRNARGIDRHELQGFVAAWRKNLSGLEEVLLGAHKR
jgi:hypothetical protein